MASFAENLTKKLGSSRNQDGLPYIRQLRTLELPLGSNSQNVAILDAVKAWPKHDGVTRLSKLVLEADGVDEDRQFQDMLDSLAWVVPEVVVTRLSEDGPRWYEF